jgi:Ca-activated chloride channel family protein
MLPGYLGGADNERFVQVFPMHFANPEAFLLLPLVALTLWWSLRPQRRGTARFSTLGLARRLPAGWAVWGPSVLLLARTMALTLLVAALARPQTSRTDERSHSDGIAIQLIIDNSYSMRTRDYDMGSQSVSRLEAVKHAVRLFVQGGEHGLAGRPNDKIGIITFARDPDVVCPATLDHAAVLDALERIELAPPVGTNIGDALAWGLDRLRHDPTKQKVIILLSDGSHNVKDSLSPMDAAQLAADLKIKVYTIGAVGNRFERNQSVAMSDLLRLASRQRGNSEDSVDEPAMRQIASRTGGQYYRATDTNGLTSIYQEIDRLETTRIEKTSQTTYFEWFLPLVAAGAVLLALEQLLSATRFLRIP